METRKHATAARRERLIAFPFRTFDEIAALGLEVHLYCPRCYRWVGPINLAEDRLRGKPFTAVRFSCSNMRNHGFAVPKQLCGCHAHLAIRYPPEQRIPTSKAIPWYEIGCGGCRWEVSQAPRHRPPWRETFSRPGPLLCPGCRREVWAHLHGTPTFPGVEGYEPGSGHGLETNQ